MQQLGKFKRNPSKQRILQRRLTVPQTGMLLNMINKAIWEVFDAIEEGRFADGDIYRHPMVEYVGLPNFLDESPGIAREMVIEEIQISVNNALQGRIGR